MMMCWWCGEAITTVSVPTLLTGRETRQVNVHLGEQTRDETGRQVCILLGQE